MVLLVVVQQFQFHLGRQHLQFPTIKYIGQMELN